MKKITILCLAGLFVFAFFTESCAQKNKKDKAVTLNNRSDTISYIIGRDIASRLKSFGTDFSPEVMYQAMKDEFDNQPARFTSQETDSLMGLFQDEMKAKQEVASKDELQKNIAASGTFLAENKSKEGVIELPSGLQYKVITPGLGDNPVDSDSVTVHYKGSLIDGTVFDSSYDRGTPVTFKLDEVIPGWREGVKLMKPGAKYVLYIPPQLGYGEKPVGPIPAGSTLIFEVELLSIKK
jgi:FKBP-type peptidyl-prolyl cis-trans isomerase FklB